MSSRAKLRAVALAAVMVGSVFAVTAVPADGKLLSGGNAAVSQTGSAEDVVVNDATIDTSTPTTIEVAYDTTLATSDIAIEVTNDDTNDVIATKSSGFTAKEDTVSITIPDSSTTGVPDTSDFR
jgi:surface glycoprotein (TIGR04207 family)